MCDKKKSEDQEKKETIARKKRALARYSSPSHSFAFFLFESRFVLLQFDLSLSLSFLSVYLVYFNISL
jgi:hypothetical protein